MRSRDHYRGDQSDAPDALRTADRAEENSLLLEILFAVNPAVTTRPIVQAFHRDRLGSAAADIAASGRHVPNLRVPDRPAIERHRVAIEARGTNLCLQVAELDELRLPDPRRHDQNFTRSSGRVFFVTSSFARSPFGD